MKLHGGGGDLFEQYILGIFFFICFFWVPSCDGFALMSRFLVPRFFGSFLGGGEWS